METTAPDLPAGDTPQTANYYLEHPAPALVVRPLDDGARQDFGVPDPCRCNGLDCDHQRGDQGFCRVTLDALSLAS